MKRSSAGVGAFVVSGVALLMAVGVLLMSRGNHASRDPFRWLEARRSELARVFRSGPLVRHERVRLA